MFEGPVDVVGDVHGEINALRLLLWHLGYDREGNHAGKRRLVFLGDLVDRGPDSPAVLDLVMKFVKKGRAQCILGNHELNLLRNERKHGNDWWFASQEEERKHSFKAATGEQKQGYSDFLLTLPLALERDDLRAVHACWHRDSIDHLARLRNFSNALEFYKHFEGKLNHRFEPRGMTKAELDRVLTDRDHQPDLMTDLARHEADYQMGNPVRVLNSGEEAPAKKPFWAGGKWRMVERVKWWDRYDDDTAVVVGHYWRRFAKIPDELQEKDGPDLFEGIEPHHWMGKRRNVYCVDFSVGFRSAARKKNLARYKQAFRLAALRWPERAVMYDNGSSADLE